MKVMEGVAAERRLVVPEPGLVEQIVGENSVLDVIAAEEARRRVIEATNSPDGAGLVAGMLLGGLSWAVILASIWLIAG